MKMLAILTVAALLAGCTTTATTAGSVGLSTAVRVLQKVCPIVESYGPLVTGPDGSVVAPQEPLQNEVPVENPQNP